MEQKQGEQTGAEDFSLKGDPAPRPKRGDDSAELLLPNMEHFVTLTRRTKQPWRVLQLVERICQTEAPADLDAVARASKAVLTPPYRRKVYQWVAAQSLEDLARLEQCCDRIHALRDEFGVQAVLSFLDKSNGDDALAMAEPSDKFTRALYLFMAQEFPVVFETSDHRFDHAEQQQSMNQHWGSEDYASHFLSLTSEVPRTDDETLNQLRARIAALYPDVDPAHIVIEHFSRTDHSHAHRHDDDEGNDSDKRSQHTITATFNGTKAMFKQVAQSEVVEREEPAALDVVFSWEPETGMLGVFCASRSLRPTLAGIFQAVLLGGDEQVGRMPMYNFDLHAFGSRAILNRIANSLVDGVDAVSIQKIRLTNVTRSSSAAASQGALETRHLRSHLEISRDRRDDRDIYSVADVAYKLSSFASEDISRVCLSLAISRQVNRRAHNIALQITLPNGLSSRSKTADDRRLVFQQLLKLGIMTEAAAA